MNIQVIPCKILIASDPQRVNNFAKIRTGNIKIPFTEQIISCNIIILIFYITESGKHPLKFQVFVYLLIPGESGETGFIFVGFLPAKKYIQPQVCCKIWGENCST